MPAQVPKTGNPPLSRSASGSKRPRGLEQHRDRGRLAAGDDQRVEGVELIRRADLDGLGAQLSEDAGVRGERALQRQHADGEPVVLLVGGHLAASLRAPPVRSPAPVGELDVERGDSRPGMARPSPRLTLARMSGSRKWVVASTMALATSGGVSLLKMPEPTNTASAPSCMTSAASAGVAMPPAQNSGTGSQPVSAISCTSGSGACRRLAQSNSSAESADADLADVADDRAQVTHRLDDVAGAGLALRADHGRALADAAQRLAEVGGAAHERAR